MKCWSKRDTCVAPIDAPLLQRIFRTEHAPKRCDDRRLRLTDRWHVPILFPASAECLVQRDELLRYGALRCRVLLLEIVLLPFGIDDIEKVREPAVVALRRQAHRSLTRH